MRAALFTREYPPHVYGGAGVHVDYLSRELARKIEVEVHCWGEQHSDEGNLHVTWRAALERNYQRNRRQVQGGARGLQPQPDPDQGAFRCRCGAHPHLVCRHGRFSGKETLRNSLCAQRS